MPSYPSPRSVHLTQKPHPRRRNRKLSVENLESRRLLAVFIVDTFTDSASGTCGVGGTGNSGCSLRSAIIAANAAPGADTINLPIGTHTLSIQNSSPVPDQARGDLNITDALTIISTDVNLDPTTTIVDAAQIDRVFSIGTTGAPITVVLNGITIQNGLAPLGLPGGGIDAGNNTNLELRNVVVQNNRVDSSVGSGGDADGGGIATSGNLLLDDVSLANNFAEAFGGGIAMFEAGTLSIRDSNISDNMAGADGGGIWAGNGANYQINLFEMVLIERNQAGPMSRGGGIYVDGGNTAASVSLSLVEFVDNRSGDAGGGAYVQGVRTFTQDRGRYEDNQSTDGDSFGGGGGLYLINNGTSTINGTIFRNNVSVSGGGGAAILTDATLRNTLFDNNRTTSNATPGTLRFDDGGGALAIAASSGIVGPTVRIEDSSFLNNTAPLAGAIGAVNSNVEIVDATIQGNSTTDSFPGAGGIGFAQDDTNGVAGDRVRLTITDSTITGNTSASDAGGIGIADADATISNSTISGNQSTGRGAGIGVIGINNAPSLRLDRVTVDNNTAGTDGGGIGVQNASFTISNTTISNNTASNNGGGILFLSADPLLTGAVEFSTIASNRAGVVGSNIAVNGSVTRFLSSIVSDPLGNAPIVNIVSGGPGEVSSQGFNVFANANFSNPSSSDLLGVDPLLGALANNGGAVRTRALLTGSPAIDAGANAPLAVDARGLARPSDGDGNSVARNDIGAFELQATAIVVTAANTTLPVIEDTDAPLNLLPLVTVSGSSTAPTLTITTQPARGTVTLAGTTATFDPAQDDFTLAGSPLTFVYTATVGTTSDTGTVTVNISPVNDPPAFVADAAVSATQSVPLTVIGSTVLTNDRPGPANETGIVSIASVTATSAQGGTVTLNGQNIVYTSTMAFTGADTITYSIGDGASPPLTTTATLTVNVTAGGITVDAISSSLAVTEDINATLNLLPLVTVSGSSTTPTLTITTQPARGTVTLAGTTATFDPAQDDFTLVGSPLTFVYTATVGTISDTGTVTVNISPVNDPPVFVADAVVSATQSVPLTVIGSTVLTNDRPGPANETGPVSIASVTATSAQGGTVTLNGQNIVYSSAAGFTGADTVTYSINDGASPPLTTSATLTVNVVSPGTTATIHTLSTGSGDGGVTLQVDSFGVFGSGALPVVGGATADYDPVGPLNSAPAVFESFVAFRTGASGPRLAIGDPEFTSAPSPDVTLENAVSGSLTEASSSFRIGLLSVDLVQRVEPTLDANGVRVGSRLTQTYSVSNPTATQATLDLVRFNHADLLFDGSAQDGGGVLFDSNGDPTLFVTDPGSVGSTDATFVGTATQGGMTQVANRFRIDGFTQLANLVLSGAVLDGAVVGDTSGDGFIDVGNEYDVALALRNLLTINPGQSIDYVTTTIFGSRPDSIVNPGSSEINGQVSCDANGNGVIDAGEAMSGVTVFIDQDGDRLFDEGEQTTLTDTNGNYLFTNLNLVAGQTANVVLVNPPSCIPAAGDIGVTRSALQTGSLSRGIASTDIDRDGDSDLLIVNDLSNNVTVLLNDNNTGGFTLGSPVQLGKRPQSISVWQPSSSSSPVIAVAAVGDVQNKGSIYVVENGAVRELSAGNGPVSVVANDFNGDGRADFVATSFRSGTIVARMSGETNERVLGTARSPRSIKSAFINDDRIVDLVVVASGFQSDDSSEVVVLLGDGRGGFTTLSQSISGQGFVDVEVANFDSDTADEIVVASYNGRAQVFDFAGGRFNQIASVSTQTGVESIAARDINGDGRADLVIANAKVETVELFINLSTGFVRGQTVTGVASPSDIVIANFDNDGVLDIAVSNLYGRTQPNFVFPSTATILGLTVSEQEVTVSANQTATANFGLLAAPSATIRPLAEGERNYDVNGDGRVAATDVLMVINAMSRQQRGDGEISNRSRSHMLDVNGDGKTTAVDALHIINHLARQTRAKYSAGQSLAESLDAKRKLSSQSVDSVMADMAKLV